MRSPHFLNHNRGGEYPREVCIVDTETEQVPIPEGGFGHRLKFGWAFYSRRVRGDRWEAQSWHRFETVEEFWSWALRRVRSRGVLTIYCHNAEFDAQVLNCFGIMARRKWKLVTACLEGPPTIIKWRRGSRSIKWLDTLNLWRVPLKEIGEKVGLPKLKMPKSWKSRERDDIYCKRDVEILWRALLSWWAFLKQHDLGTAAPTLAGQAFTSFRHRFMNTPIFIDANEGALALARAAYVGGRCECFRLGLQDETIVTLDVNSMYPFVMRELQAPVKLLAYRTAATLADLERYLKSYAVVADVELVTETPAYPKPVDGRLCFPIGAFRAQLATPELLHAMRAGAVRRLYAVAVYERAEVFRAFVEWAWRTRMEARAKGDKLLDWQVKIMANSLYGKFGQRGKQWEVVGASPEYKVRSLTSFNLDLKRWQHVRQIGHALQELKDKGESLHSHPAIAAHVTSAGRMHLWRLMERAGARNVYYVDTDGLKGNRAMVKRLKPLIAPKELGGLKVEKREPWLIIHGCKDYEGPEQRRMKGVRASAESNDEVAYLQLQWMGWAGSIQRGSLDMPITSEVVKVLQREYTKGDVGHDGRVLPLRLLGR